MATGSLKTTVTFVGSPLAETDVIFGATVSPCVVALTAPLFDPSMPAPLTAATW